MKKSLPLFTIISTVLATLIVALCVYGFSGCRRSGDNADERSVEQPDETQPAPDGNMHEYPERRDGMPEVIRNKKGVAVGFRGNFDGGEFFVIRFGDNESDQDELDKLFFGRNPLSHRLPKRHIPAPVEQ